MAYVLYSLRISTIEKAIQAQNVTYQIQNERDIVFLFDHLFTSQNAAVKSSNGIEATRLMHEIAERDAMRVEAPKEIARLHELARS